MSCASYRRGQLCADGFPMSYPASSACTGSVCDCCQRPNDKLPACMDEDINAMWLNDDGTPKHRPATNPTKDTKQ